MIESLSKIRIQGRCFSNSTDFIFFNNDGTSTISVVYGKNGSGKSTLATALQHIAQGNLSGDLTGQIFDKSNNDITEKLANKIEVFNEDFVDNNIKIESSGLSTIVLFGEQVELQQQIENIQQNIKENESFCSSKETELARMNDKEDEKSVSYIFEKICDKLRSRWAEEDRIIRDGRKAASVNVGNIKKIMDLQFNESKDLLEEQLNNNKSLLQQTKNGKPVLKEIVSISFQKDLDQKICNLLSKPIQKIELTEREALIMSLIKTGHQTRIDSARSYFSRDDVHTCPFCFQEVSESYCHGLIDSINKVLNKEVDSHKKELSEITFPNLNIDLSPYKEIEATLVERIKQEIYQCNNLITQYKELIQEKANNTYNPIEVNSLGLSDKLFNLNQSLLLLENTRKNYKKICDNIELLINETAEINSKIAHLEISDDYKTYRERLDKKQEITNELSLLKDERLDLEKQLSALQQQKANVKLAVNQINKGLNFVFCTRNRLRVEYKDKSYHLTSNEKDIRPKDASIGERNVLALCYFFVKISSNQEFSKRYSQEKLLIIDDPISSTDFDNRIGLLSLLKHQLCEICKGNPRSKILLLTHDLFTFQQLKKIASEIKSISSYFPQGIKTSSFRLENHTLKKDKEPFNEYKTLLQVIYKYAEEDTPHRDLYIGNYLRKIVEAFSTFSYAEPIEHFVFTPDGQTKLGEHSDFFQGFMGKLMLNAESHSENQIYAMVDDYAFCKIFSDEEIHQTCRSVLCLMYKLNPEHITRNLEKTTFNTATIEKWLSEIPTNE